MAPRCQVCELLGKQTVGRTLQGCEGYRENAKILGGPGVGGRHFPAGGIYAGDGPRAEKAGQGGGGEGCLGVRPAGHRGPGEREVVCKGPVSGIGGQGMKVIPDYRILEIPVCGRRLHSVGKWEPLKVYK